MDKKEYQLQTSDYFSNVAKEMEFGAIWIKNLGFAVN